MNVAVFRVLAVLTAMLALCGRSLAGGIEDIRVVGNGEPTRITIWTDSPLTHRQFLSGDTTSHAIVIAVPGAEWRRDEPTGRGMGGVERFEWRQDQLTLFLDRPMMIARALDLPPAGSEPRHRIILDLETVSPVRFARNASTQAALQVAAYNQSILSPPAPRARPVARSGDEKFVVVIDPGHGGRDPGASRHGTIEKDVVLRASQTLKSMLEQDRRYEVRLTREDDRFIELEDRVTLARNWGADLFISIHADAAGSPGVAGASVYSISQRGEARIDREAQRNDWHLPIEDGGSEAVGGILTDFLKRETKTKSSEFAELLIPELARAGPVLRNTHRNAGFYVLLAPDVPAVLVEIGFLTNAEDARRLRSRNGRRRAMQAIKRAIDAYFDKQSILLAEN